MQLTGRFAWPRSLIIAARNYTRETTGENLEALASARRSAAADVIGLQSKLGVDYLTDGGVGVFDVFAPYLNRLRGVKETGNIDKYPGTRNSYYHIPIVDGRLGRENSMGEEYLHTSQYPEGTRKKAILPSPAAFALASENSHYGSLEELILDFSEILREDILDLGSRGYDYIQLSDGFLANQRFKHRISRGLVKSLLDGLRVAFDGFRGRSAFYLHSGDASGVLSDLLHSEVTDIGFDFNTPLENLDGITVTKNMILGLQNSTRKLPRTLLPKEAEALSGRARDAISALGIGSGAQVYLCPSQDFDGLQTFPQALSRMLNLAEAVRMLRVPS
ncbi:MAG: hypothetical protein HY296_01710 [Thaumarchaeota archaeon]|nr:hypothetical protein [Nitrososphaerota archaeon]